MRGTGKTASTASFPLRTPRPLADSACCGHTFFSTLPLPSNDAHAVGELLPCRGECATLMRRRASSTCILVVSSTSSIPHTSCACLLSRVTVFRILSAFCALGMSSFTRSPRTLHGSALVNVHANHRYHCNGAASFIAMPITGSFRLVLSYSWVSKPVSLARPAQPPSPPHTHTHTTEHTNSRELNSLQKQNSANHYLRQAYTHTHTESKKLIHRIRILLGFQPSLLLFHRYVTQPLPTSLCPSWAERCSCIGSLT